jgi:peptidoglycan/LPS O-acetylase OafA/YrhL
MSQSAEATPTAQPYLIQLDALRSIAITGVLIGHYLPETWWINTIINWGGMGVRLFFVISGFLITGILLRARDQVLVGTETRSLSLKKFYIRRSLRIFPIYYLMLVIAFIANSTMVRQTILWHLTYTTNFYLAIENQWLDKLSAFWSLAVEEQFYLIWPFFILFCPPRWLKSGIIGTIALGVIARYLMVRFELNAIWIATSLVTHLDLLGAGGLLAFMNYQNPGHNYRNYALCKLGLWIGTPVYLFLHVLNHNNHGDHLTLTIAQLALTGCCAWLVQAAARGFTGGVGRLLESKPVVQFGKLSYGIYIYHMYAPDIMYRFFHIPYVENPILRFPISLTITILTTYLSWKLIEQPILKLKKHFSYSDIEKTR